MSLKHLREEAKLTQRELGARLAKAVPPADGNPKYFQPRVSSYETGRNNMPVTVALALVKILNRALKRAGSSERATIERIVAPDKEKAPA